MDAQLRRDAATKAWETRRRNEAAAERRCHLAGVAAAATRATPVSRGRRTAKHSQEALQDWAKRNHWKLVFLDADSGNPRTGIVDAVLLRIAPRHPDVLQVKLVQLKGGSAGMTPAEVVRLEEAVRTIEVSALCALHAGTELRFLSEPEP